MAKAENDYIDSFFQDNDETSGNGSGAGMSSAFERAYDAMNTAESRRREEEPSMAEPDPDASEPAVAEPVVSGTAQPSPAGSVSAASRKALRTAEQETKTVHASAVVPAARPSGAIDKEIATRRRLRIAGGVFSWVKEIVIALVIAWLFITFIAQSCTVSGGSMLPTLEDGQMVIVNKIGYRFTEPKRGDIVVFTLMDEVKGEERLIKRVIGLPGDTVEIMEGKVYINGKPYDESKYLDVETEATGNIQFPYMVPENSYFVLGDNRAISKDSRYFGAVEKKDMMGCVLFRYWPLKEFGLVS